MDTIANIFFFNDTATTEIYTLSLHDALPIFHRADAVEDLHGHVRRGDVAHSQHPHPVRQRPLPIDNRRRVHAGRRSEEHTSELQSRQYLVCRLLLEKKANSSASDLLITDEHT